MFGPISPEAPNFHDIAQALGQQVTTTEGFPTIPLPTYKGMQRGPQRLLMHQVTPLLRDTKAGLEVFQPIRGTHIRENETPIAHDIIHTLSQKFPGSFSLDVSGYDPRRRAPIYSVSHRRPLLSEAFQPPASSSTQAFQLRDAKIQSCMPQITAASKRIHNIASTSLAHIPIITHQLSETKNLPPDQRRNFVSHYIENNIFKK